GGLQQLVAGVLCHHHRRWRTFLAHGDVLVGRLVVPLAVAQVAGVDRHRGFDLQLGQLHAIVEDPEELLRLLVCRQSPEEGILGASEGV
uniref:Uncharacterized protein n=1 Tax=Gadus morhua TaxID=8049 RepID=A0A8C5AL36_GADMO